jgi:hypothetical protein
MSWVEVRDREGLPYGGMPYDVILDKLEETDPELVDEVRGYDEFHDLEGEYGDYVRSEIIDWSPDAPFLESDHTRRDPGLSRSILNLHYNGTRGSQPELPRHPELFYGFTGNDPRGAGDDPRFDQMRGHITSRAAELTVSMGDNDDHSLAERPWTGQSLSYGMKELHRRVRDSTRVFAVQKEGRPWGRHYVADQFAPGAIRDSVMDTGDESLEYQTDDYIPKFRGGPGLSPYPVDDPVVSRFHAGDHGLAADLQVQGVRGVDGAYRDDAEIAPWRHVVGEADLGVQQYGQKRGAGRTQIKHGAIGGGRVVTGAQDQTFAESRHSRGGSRRVLGATMALAARSRAVVKSAEYQHIFKDSQSLPAWMTPGARLKPSDDVGMLYRHVVEDQQRRPGSEIEDDAGGRHGAARGLTPAYHPEHAIRAGQMHTTPNDHLTNVESIVTGLREGTAAGRREIASRVIADGSRHLRSIEIEPNTRRGAIPSADYGRITTMSKMPFQRAAAADGLVAHSYRGAPPARPEQRAAIGRTAFDAGTWRRQHEMMPIGLSKTPAEWRSATQGQSLLGDSPDRVFGATAEVPGSHGAAPTGPKSLRPAGWSDSANLSDSVGGFSDMIEASA